MQSLIRILSICTFTIVAQDVAQAASQVLWPQLTIVLFTNRPTTVEREYLIVQVTDTKGRPIKGIVLSTAGDGSTSPPTNDAGKTRIKLAPETQPDDIVQIQVVRAPGNQDLVFISPWDGHVRIPRFENKSGNVQHIVLGGRSDKALLTDPRALRSLVKSIVKETLPKTTYQTITEEQRKLVLAEQSKKYGLSPEEVEQAIVVWRYKAMGPRDRGLAAFYMKDYPEATEQLSKSYQTQKANGAQKGRLDKARDEDVAYFGECER